MRPINDRLSPVFFVWQGIVIHGFELRSRSWYLLTGALNLPPIGVPIMLRSKSQPETTRMAVIDGIIKDTGDATIRLRLRAPQARFRRGPVDPRSWGRRKSA